MSIEFTIPSINSSSFSFTYVVILFGTPAILPIFYILDVMKISRFYLSIFVLVSWASSCLYSAFKFGILSDDSVYTFLWGLPLAVILIIYLYRNPLSKKK